MSSQRKVVRKHATRARHGRDDHVCSGIPPPAQAGSSFKPCGHNLAGSAAACGPPGDGKPLDLTQLSSEQRSKLESFLKSSGFGPLPKAGQTLDAATMRKLAQHMRAAAAMPSKTPLRNWGDTEKNPKDGLVRQAVTNSKRDDVKNLLEEGGDVDEAEPKTLCTPLMLAVRDGSKEIVQLLLDYDADVTRRDKDGKTAIMEACAAGRDDLVQLLIDHGSCVADTDNGNWNSLTHAAANGHVRCAEVVMRHLKYDKETQERLKEVVKKEDKRNKKTKEKGKPNELDDYDEAETAAESALAIAAQKGQYEFVKWYLAKKEQFKASEAEIQAACSRACYSKRLDLVRLVVEDYGAKVNPEGPVIETPLCAAAACGDADIVKYLLTRGARVNESDASGFTPLMRACNEGNGNLVPVLLHHEANVNAQNVQEDNSTPLCYAVRKGNLEIVRTLVSAQANVNLGGTPPLLLAISMCNADAVEYLLANGANPVQKSSHNDTALAFAAEVGNFDLVKRFHGLGCDVDCVGEKGYTPLMRAAKKGSLEIIEYLLANGASINRASSTNDCTALSLACNKGWIKIIEFLLERGANRHIKLKDNVTPLLEAVKSGNSEAADLVLYYQPKNENFREPMNVAVQQPGVRGAPNMPAPVNEFYNIHSNSNYACKHCDGLHGEQMLRASDESTDEEDEDDEDDVDEEDDDDQEGVYNEEMDEECETGDEDDEEMHDDEDDYTSDDQSNDEDKKELENYELPDILPGDLADLVDFPQGESDELKEGLDADIDFIRNQLEHFQPQSFEFRILNAMLKKAEQLQKSLPNHTPEELRRRFSEEISRWQNELQSNSNVDDLMEKLEDLPIASDEPTLADIASFLQANPSLQDYSSLLLQRHADMFPPGSHPLVDSEGKEIKRGMSLSPDGKYIVMTSSNTNFTAPLGTEFELLRSIAAAADANPSIGGGLDNLPEDLAKVMAEARNKGVFNMEAFSTFLRGAREDERFLEATRVPSTFNFSTTTPPASLVAAARPLEKLRNKYASKKTLDGRIPRTPEPTPDDTSEEGFQGSDDVPPTEAKTAACKQQMPRILKKAIRNTRDASTNVTSTVPPPKKPALVDVDLQQESDASTALIQAAIRGNSKIIAMLCDAGSKPNHKDKKGWTALGYAVERGHKEAVKELCDHGADVDGVMDTNQAKRDSSLTIACYNGRVEIVRILLDHKGNIEHRNSNDYTPLCVACLNGHHRVAQLLIQRGADINARGTKLGIAPLMLAAMNGHTTIVKLLIENSADVNQCIETNRNTALTLACFQGRTECVRVLVEKGANLEWRSKNGLNALMEAANGGFFEIGKILVENGAEVNCAPVPSTKDTPLTIAAEKGHAKFVQLLIDNDAAINVRNKKGCSPLWLACQNGHLDCVRALVASGKADVDARDNRQMSCILTAFKRGHENIVKILVDHIRCYPSEEEMTRYCKDIKLTGNNNYLSAVFERCKKAILDAKHKKEAEADAKARSLLEELDLQQKTKEGQRAKKRDKKKQKKKTGKNDDDDSSITGTSNARTNDSEPNSKSPSAAHSRSGSVMRPETLPLVHSAVNGKAFEEEPDDGDDDDAKAKKRKKKRAKKAKTTSAPDAANAIPEPSPIAPAPRKASIPELAVAASNLIKQINLQDTEKNVKTLQKGKAVISAPVKESTMMKTETVTGKRPATAPATHVPEPPAESDDGGADENDARAGDRGVDVSADEWVQQRSKSQKVSGAFHGPQTEKSSCDAPRPMPRSP
ncbi:ankyrin repeat and KH domain-containing protein 1-like isoform X2 [Paramacrobiotus metropolitanus]|uniref:ankyrin repeat and KH domain-containing protein 1-like isoform X2 n=1 Tax=Paramacrobiotus metropolitanus TaxID=2943436 RepID=UPI0024457689|nr:ankyrin repeat and KH domain-containing protein 1-like isoform X2 [Paramacrobiotus metropolitanus]